MAAPLHIYDPGEDLIPDDSPQVETQPYLHSVPTSGTSGPTHQGDLSAIPDTPEELEDKEASPHSRTTSDGSELSLLAGGAAGAEAGASDVVGTGFDPNNSGGRIQKFKAAVAQNRKKLLIGGASGGTAMILVFFGFAAILPYELVHAAEILKEEEAKVVMRDEKTAAKDLLNKLVCRASAGKVGSCKNDPDEGDSDPAEKNAEETAAESTTDPEPLIAEADAINLDSGVIAAALHEDGVTVTESPSGQITGITNTEGQDVSSDLTDAAPDLTREFQGLEQIKVNDAVAEGQVQADLNPLAKEESEDDTKDPETAVDKGLEEAVDDGATNEELAQTEVEVDSSEPQTLPKNPDAFAKPVDIGDAAGALGDAAKTATTVDEQTGNSGEAIEQATELFDEETAVDTTSVAGIATMACSAEQTVHTAAKDRLPQLMTLLMRHGFLLLSLANKMMEGKLKSNDANQIGGLLNGNSSAPAGSEASMSFDSSASFHRATNQTVNSSPTEADGKTPNPNFTPDVAAVALPEANFGTIIIDKIQNLMNAFKLNLACGVLTSPFGFIVQAAAGVVQIIGDIGSFGGAEAATIAGGVAFQQALNKDVLPQVIKEVSNLGVNGSEDAVQFTNNSDMGMNIAFNNYSRRKGGVPMTNDQTRSKTAEVDSELAAYNDKQPWTYRTFAFDNPSSLTSYVMDRVPLLSVSTASSSILGYLTSFPSMLLHDFSSLFVPHSLADASQSPAVCADSADPDPANPYCLTQYAYQDSDLEKYDPILNEQHLHTSVSATGCLPTLDGHCIKPITVSATRIKMLGDPSKYNDLNGDDPDSGDLLHCFVDSVNFPPFANEDESTGSPDPLCGTIGNFSMIDNPTVVIPGDSAVITIYCSHLLALLPAGYIIPNCGGQVSPSVTNMDDVGHFRQYLMDLSNMQGLTSLTNNQ